MCEAIILAGGLGKRLRTVISNKPKVMAPIGEYPFIQYLLDYPDSLGISKVVLSVGFLYESIYNYLGNNYGNINIKYSVEEKPLGTGGAIKRSIGLTKTQDVIVINGDTFTTIDYNKMMKTHKDNGEIITVAIKYEKNRSRYGNILVKNNRICEFIEKTKNDGGYINVGSYIINRKIFDQFDLPPHFSFEKEFMQCYINKINPMSYLFDGMFIDIGLPQSYARAKSTLLKIPLRIKN